MVKLTWRSLTAYSLRELMIAALLGSRSFGRVKGRRLISLLPALRRSFNSNSSWFICEKIKFGYSKLWQSVYFWVFKESVRIFVHPQHHHRLQDQHSWDSEHLRNFNKIKDLIKISGEAHPYTWHSILHGMKHNIFCQKGQAALQDTFSSARTRWLKLFAASCRTEFNSCRSSSFLPTNWWIWVLCDFLSVASIVCDIWNEHMCRI